MTREASVLYDAPGPKAKVRNVIYSVIVAVAVVAALAYVYRGLADQGQFDADKWKPFLEADI